MSLLLALVLGSGCAPKVGAPAAAAAPPVRPILAWRIERDGKVSHVIGTCHVGIALDDAVPQADELLASSRVLVTEADLDLGGVGDMMRLLFVDGPRIHDRVPRDHLRAVGLAVGTALPITYLDRLHPWVVSASLPMLLAPGGLNPEGGLQRMDKDLQARADARGIPHRFVETLAEQAELLGAMDDVFLDGVGPTRDEDTREWEGMRDLCVKGDVDAVAGFGAEPSPELEVMIMGRTRAWVPKLLPELADGGALIAVGAGHVVGPQGLVALFEREGYTATRLSTTRAASSTATIGAPYRILPAPPLPADFDAKMAPVVDELVATQCAAASMVRACFYDDDASCRVGVRTDALLCVDQAARPDGHGGVVYPRAADVVTCVGGGVMIERYMAGTIPEGGLCGMLKAGMDAAVKAKLGDAATP